jgi:hypothetical protein
MKTALKCKNDEFLARPLKNVLSLMGLVSHPRTPKLLAIVHENGPKMQKRRVFVTRLKNVLSLMGLVKNPEPPNCGQ